MIDTDARNWTLGHLLEEVLGGYAKVGVDGAVDLVGAGHMLVEHLERRGDETRVGHPRAVMACLNLQGEAADLITRA
jgi:hypothetical protein